MPESHEPVTGVAPPAAPDEPTPGPVRWVVAALEILGGVGLFLLMMLTVSDALLRSFANRPILGAADTIQVLLVVVVACSIPLCIAGGRAIAIEFVVNLLAEGKRRMLLRLTSLMCAVVLAYLSWRCFVNAREAALFGETTMLLQIPFGPFYTVLSVAFGISSALFLLQAVRGRTLS
jgi:TRAP-type C4-dicarboxylate transport system permease small subunit